MPRLRRHTHQSSADASGALTGQSNRPAHTVVATNDKHMAKPALVTIVRPRWQGLSKRRAGHSPGRGRHALIDDSRDLEVIEHPFAHLLSGITGVEALLEPNKRQCAGRLHRCAKHLAGLGAQP
jgi:hypothetical protein